ncbi:hypothetical protein Pyn_01989 [Prunus yedoensis var. nudiflora]|uniref:Increased DNA methylation 1 C-terminal domain-containing protein n=1 Tax=Prunus yedoensis var. nudiflora TaxID=2094558 RepID=A0A314XZG3_PRUYE|nr:hypothetical protein Pyn_01989 [Prunus yedoensis var. nudiflora]
MEGTPKDTVSRYKIMNGRKSKQKLLVQAAVLSINVIELEIHQIIRSFFSRINFKGKNTAILEKDDEITSAASIRIHGTRMAEMPFVATQQKFGRKGLLLQKW